MSATRWGRKWADFDDEDDTQEAQGKFETQADKDGIKSVVEYTEKNGTTYKITKKVKEIKTTKWTNASIQGRKQLEKFGKAEGPQNLSLIQSFDADRKYTHIPY